MIKKTLISISTFVLFIVLLVAWMAAPYEEVGSFPGDVIELTGSDENRGELSDTVTIMTWNIAYGFGVGSEGPGYETRDESFYQKQLKAVATVIRDFNIDIVLMQEVDHNAARSHGINQSEFIAKEAGFRYIAPITSWESNYVPFPYWPVKNQFGKIVSGGAVISKFPIKSHTFQLYELPEKNPWWYNLFYLYRYSQFVEIDFNGLDFMLVNSHLEAFDIKSRELQAEILASNLSKLNQSILLSGGDFNTVPQESEQKTGFDDHTEDDYRNDKTLEILRQFTKLKEPKDSTRSLSYYHTFPPSKPNRQLDYLFVNRNYKVLDYKVLNVGELSDHLPLITTIVLKR